MKQEGKQETMTPHELRQKLGAIAKQQDDELDKFEQEQRGKYRQLRRGVLQEAGIEVAIAAECEDQFYEFWPPKSDLPPGAKLVEYD